MGTGAVGDVIVPAGLVVVELEVVEATELLSVRSVDGIEVESDVEVLDSMLAVAEDWLAAVDEAATEVLDSVLAVFDVKVFAADKVPDAALDTAETVLVVTGATVVIELPDATVMGVVADPVTAADDSALLSEFWADWVADSALLAELGAGATLVCGAVEVPAGTTTVFEATAEEATGTTKLMSVVASAAEGETESTEFALDAMDESSDAALERADVTITPGAVSVMVMAIV